MSGTSSAHAEAPFIPITETLECLRVENGPRGEENRVTSVGAVGDSRQIGALRFTTLLAGGLLLAGVSMPGYVSARLRKGGVC